MNLNQVTLPCTDYVCAVAFYRLLGCQLIVDISPRYARFEAANGTTFSIHSCDDLNRDKNVVIYFEVDDVDARVN